MKKLIVSIISLLLSACVTIPTNVVVTYEETSVSSCEEIGVVGNGWFLDASPQMAIASAANKAKNMGADTLLIRETEKSFAEVSILGSAYKCND